MPKLLGLATEIDTKNIRSYVFSPPLYSQDTCQDSRGCVVLPKISAIRSSVENAFKVDPELEARREALAAEGAKVWVLNGMSDATSGRGWPATSSTRAWRPPRPRAKPEGAVPADTQIVVYNGAEAELAQTIAYLEQRFKVEVELANDPAMRADVVITVGRDTPDLRPPPSS